MKIELFFQPPTRLCAQIDDERCAIGVKPVWASPLSRPGQYLSILDAKGEDLVMLTEPQRELSSESWQAVQAEIRRRDLTSRVLQVISAREDNGAVYFSVATDRGNREFVCTNLSTNAIWFGENRLLFLDTDGNRFDVEDLAGLDERSRALIEGIL